ncbi:unnamed protein product, partial [Toxocara canis]|uniref:BPI1 domain-containing protein n=1 Tax=Toxocara canis TaxID=6265 RepID=A0A183UIC7_TOXCA
RPNYLHVINLTLHKRVSSAAATCDPQAGGIRARLNRPAFAYLSGLFASILNEQIINAEIPPILQCIPGLPVSVTGVNGCVKIYNIFVSRYRCPQRVLIYPDKPNKIVLSVQNFDIGITATLGGQINILLPIPLCGTIQLNIHRVSLAVEVIIEEKCDHFNIKIAGCSITVGYVDVYMERAGLIGDLVNGLFRQIVSESVRQMIPSRVCGMLPKLVDERVNAQLANIPTTISVGQLIQMLGGLEGLLGGGVARCSKTHRCRLSQSNESSQAAFVRQQLVPLSKGSPSNKVPLIASHAASQRVLTAPKTASSTVTTKQANKQPIPVAKKFPFSVKSQKASNSTKLSTIWRDNSTKWNSSEDVSTIVDVSEEIALSMLTELLDLNDRGNTNSKNNFTLNDIKKMLHNGTSDEVNRKLLQKLAQMTKDGDHFEARQILASLRHVARGLAKRSRRSPKYGAVPVVNKRPPKWRIFSEEVTESTKAPKNGTIVKKYTAPYAVAPVLTSPVAKRAKKQPIVHGTGRVVIMNGNHSRAHGCPTCVGGVGGIGGALSGSVVGGVAGNPCAGCPTGGRQTNPLDLIRKLIRTVDLSKLCNIYLSLKLLRTLATCDDYTIDLKGAFGLCADDLASFCIPTVFFPGCPNCMIEVIITDYTINSLFYQMHRLGLLSFRIGPDTPEIGPLMRTTCQDSSDPSGVSVCVGDFLPAVSRYPNKWIAVNIHTIRPPTILFSRGCATIDFAADADICVTNTFGCEGGIRVGTIELLMVADVCVQAAAGRLYGRSNVRFLRIIEKQPSLGLQPGILDQLSVLGKDLITKALNDALANGINVRIPTGGGLPLTLYNTQFAIIDHGLYISSDFSISPSLLSGSASCPR